MKISFDLDDLIIPGIKKFETEPQTIIQRFFRAEKIRKGTIALFRELRKQKHIVGIYTTSFRSVLKIKILFLLNGFSVDFIINQPRHLQGQRNTPVRSSKYPSQFAIDLHVDDSTGVEMEGKKYNFNTIIVDENEIDWKVKILRQIIPNAI